MINHELKILILGRLSQIFLALAAIKIVTTLLTPSELGNFYLLVSLVGFFGLFLVNPIGQYINRRAHEWHNEGILLNIFYLYNYYILFLCGLSIVSVYLLSYFEIGSRINQDLFLLVVPLYIYSHSWNQTIIPMINMFEGRKAFVAFTLASQLLFLVISYSLLGLMEETGGVWFLGQAIAFGIVSVFALFYFILTLEHRFSFNTAHKFIDIVNLKMVLKFSTPLSISVLFYWGQTQSYGVIIEQSIGPEFLGYFGVGFGIAMAISAAFETIVQQYLYPKMYKSMNNSEDFSLFISNITSLIIPIYFYLAIFVSIFAVNINTILVDEKYSSSYLFLIFGIWVAFFRMSSNIISNIAHSKLQTKKLILPNFIGAFISIFGLIWVVNSKSYEYLIPIVLLTAGLISFVVNFVMMNNILKIKFHLKQIYPIFLYSAPLLINIVLVDRFSSSILNSIVIVGLFGLYFLYTIYRFSLVHGKELR